MKDLDLDYLDKLEAISQGYADEYSWVDQKFINSLEHLIESGKELTQKQIVAIENIFNSAQ